MLALHSKHRHPQKGKPVVNTFQFSQFSQTFEMAARRFFDGNNLVDIIIQADNVRAT